MYCFSTILTAMADPRNEKWARKDARGSHVSTQLFASPSGSDVTQLCGASTRVQRVDTALCMAWIDGFCADSCGFKRHISLYGG